LSKQRGGGGCVQRGNAVEADRSKRGWGGEFYFLGKVRMRGSEDAIANGGDASVHTDARVKSLS
jgi:hypothetical protein